MAKGSDYVSCESHSGLRALVLHLEEKIRGDGSSNGWKHGVPSRETLVTGLRALARQMNDVADEIERQGKQ